MIKFLLVMKICSSLYGNCMPEQLMDHHNTWAECCRHGTINNMATIDLLGDDYTYVAIPPLARMQTNSRSESKVETQRMYKKFVGPKL